MLVYNYINYKSSFVLLKAPYFWAVSMLCGFFLTLLLRRWYRHFYQIKNGIILTATIIVLSSIIVGFVWLLCRAAIITQIEKHFNDGIGSFIDITKPYPLHTYFIWVVDFTWPVLAWSTLYFGIKFWRDLLAEETKAQRALLLAKNSQLQMLRYRLNPHFLFNSFNSIQALIYEDPKGADEMITLLSDLLRDAVDDRDRLYIPLGEEIGIVEKYLAIEKIRYQDRLEYAIIIPPDVRKTKVLGFILQPFVENAIKHGMFSSGENLGLSIFGYRIASSLYIDITNTGQWKETDSEGTGIKNVIERLNNAYPEKFDLKIQKDDKHVSVKIVICIEEDESSDMLHS
jgi:two-component system, LytTR family, sensor kinase